MKKLVSYQTLFEAEVACGVLKDNNIDAVVLNEFASQLPYAGNQTGSYPYIAVADEDVERAIEILGIQAVNTKPDSCPYCGGKNIKLGFGNLSWGQKILAYLMLPISAAANAPIGKVRMSYHCKSCRHDLG